MLDSGLEASIVERARSGDRSQQTAAFEALFTALREPTLRLCANLLGSDGDADDALQETFFSVHRALPAFRSEAHLSTWVYRIAIRAAIRIRARRRPQGAMPEVSAPEQAPDERAASRQRAQRVSQAMARLSLDHRTVLSLFAVDGLSHQEIAEVLGVPAGTVWSRLHTARKLLAAAIS